MNIERAFDLVILGMCALSLVVCVIASLFAFWMMIEVIRGEHHKR